MLLQVPDCDNLVKQNLQLRMGWGHISEIVGRESSRAPIAQSALEVYIVDVGWEFLSISWGVQRMEWNTWWLNLRI